MTPEEHQQEHIRLHKALDELLACYISESWEMEKHGSGVHVTLNGTSIMDLIRWGYGKTLMPSPCEEGHIVALPRILTAQNDDPELLEWLSNASQRGGGFIQSLANAGLRADHENYPTIRPLLLFFREKYTEYEPSDAVKQEIRERAKA